MYDLQKRNKIFICVVLAFIAAIALIVYRYERIYDQSVLKPNRITTEKYQQQNLDQITTVNVDGKEYQIGNCSVSDFKDAGWQISADEGKMYLELENENGEVLNVLTDDTGDRIIKLMINRTTNIHSCQSLITAGGLTIGSTKDDVESAFGKTNTAMNYNNIDIVVYYDGDGGSVAYNIYGDAGVQFIAIESENTGKK